MDPVHPRVGGGGDDGEGGQPGVGVIVVDLPVTPELVEPGERHRVAVGALHEEGLLAGLALGVEGGRRDLPLVPPLRRYETPPRARRLRERAFAQHRLGAGVRHTQTHLEVLGPRGHQPPGEQPQLTAWFGL